MVSLSTVCFLIVGYWVIVYIKYVPALFQYLTAHQPPNDQRTKALEQLVVAPTIGQFFYSHLLDEYVLQSDWEKVLSLSSPAIESPLHRGNFIVWYYKALAECLLQRVQQCQRSARIATGLHHTQGHVSELHKLATIIKQNPNIRMIKVGSEIQIVFDPSASSEHPPDSSHQEHQLSQAATQTTSDEMSPDDQESQGPPQSQANNLDQKFQELAISQL